MYITSVQPAPRSKLPGEQESASSRLRILLSRMQTDMRLAIIMLYTVCSMSIIGSFAVYRFYMGEWLVGLADTSIVAVFVALAIFACIPRWTRLAVNLYAVTASVAGIGVVVLLDLSTLWTFSILVGNFLMADRRVAVATSFLLVGILGVQPQIFENLTEQFTFIAVATMVSLFSAIFATRVDTQHGRLNEMASRDGLTDAFNRRSLDLDLQTLVDDPKVGTRSHCLAIMDLDNFKALNDQHGHEAGDEILIRLSQIVRNQTRENDRFYRYGGEEFVLLLPDTTLAGARIALVNLFNILERELTGPDGRVTSSFGLAQLQPSESVEDWLSRADQALFKAKRNGKDRIEEA